MGFGLLVLSVALVFVAYFLRSEPLGLYTNVRRSFVFSLLTNALIIFLFNESCSFFNCLNAFSALMFWVGELVAILMLLIYWQRSGKINWSGLWVLKDLFHLRGFNGLQRFTVLCMALLYICPLLFLAVYAAPNNFDSHMYHLNRILIWINNGNLDHFPTMHLQQLYLNVFAEYLVLHTILLSGSDQFAGLVQFGAFIGSLSGVSLLAGRLGLKKETQLSAILFLLTLPIGVFESTSTQVDYCACFFFISFVYFGFELLKNNTFLTLAAFLLSLAFGGFSKYTVLIFALPFAIFFALQIIDRYRIV